MSSICLIDLDDTLGDFRNPMMNALNRATGKSIHWSEYNSFNVDELYDLTYPEFMKVLLDEGVVEQTEVHEGGREFLTDLRKLGYHTVLITARGWHPRGKQLTEQWISDHSLDISELIVVGVDQSKTDVIGKFGPITFSVDDRIKHCREYMQSGRVENVFIYSQPWNKNMISWNKNWSGHDYNGRAGELSDILPYMKYNREYYEEIM